MSSRIHCWLHGHDWGAWDRGNHQDLFGNVWALRWCKQCRAAQRRCVG